MGFVRRHRLALELALLALVAYLAAVLVTTGLGTAVDDVPPAPVEAAAAVASRAPAPLADYALIAERDLFNPARGGGNGPSSHARLRLWGVGLQGREARAGRPAGFRLFQIRDDSLFAKLGLRNGDVVERVNGTQVADPTALLAFLQRLRTEPRVALDIVRGDAPRTLVYDLR